MELFMDTGLLCLLRLNGRFSVVKLGLTAVCFGASNGS